MKNALVAIAVTAVLVAPAPAGEIWLSISEPREGSSVVGEVEIVGEVLAVDEIAAVEFSVDGIPVGKLTSAPYRLPVDLGPENVGHRITLVARDRTGAEATDTVTTLPFPISGEVKVELQQLYVTATGDDDSDVRLDREQFKVFDEGSRQKIVTFADGNIPFTAVLLIDSSASMSGHRIEAARAGGDAFVAGMAELDQAKVIVFSDQLLGTTPFTDSSRILSAGLRSATARGGTALNDHLYAALTLLEPRQGRRVVVVLSDGIDTHSVLSMDQVRERSRRCQAIIYWIRLNRQLGDLPGDQGLNITSAWRSSRQYRQQLKLLDATVIESGGRIVGVDSTSEIQPVFVDILEELRRQYAIGYYPTASVNDGRWHDVRVEVTAPGIRVRTHRGYVDR
jgi:Ca-activated chloride channel family protein